MGYRPYFDGVDEDREEALQEGEYDPAEFDDYANDLKFEAEEEDEEYEEDWGDGGGRW